MNELKFKEDETFNKVMSLCDMTEKMVRAIEAPHVKNKQQLLKIVEPVVQSIDKAVKIVTETFIRHIEDDQKFSKQRSQDVDMAMKAIYDSLRAMKTKGEALVQFIHKDTNNG